LGRPDLIVEGREAQAVQADELVEAGDEREVSGCQLQPVALAVEELPGRRACQHALGRGPDANFELRHARVPRPLRVSAIDRISSTVRDPSIIPIFYQPCPLES